MAKKKEDKDKQYLLQDEELGEEERSTVTTYMPDKDKPEEITKALKRAKEDKVTYNDDGSISVKENSVLKKEDVDNLVKNFNKTTLSESEIMSILFETESPRMTKSELIEEISNQIINEADMDDSVRRKFESGDSEYSQYLDPNTVRRISQEVFGDVQRNIRDKTGRQNVSQDDVQRLLGTSLTEAIQKEQRIGIPLLEQKAVEMIKQQFNIPDDAINFQAEITGIPQLGGRPIVKGNIQHRKGNKRPPQGKTEEQLKPEITRRRLTNAMIHGSARKSQNLHHLSDELRQMDPTLNRDYGNIMAANDYMYWGMSDESISEQGRNGVHAGNSKVVLSREQGGKPTIVAQGIVFPILLHELAKGVMELMSMWSLPKDKNERDYVTDKTDYLEAETNDIRLGSQIWSKFIANIPVENQEVISLTYNLLQQLPTDEFNSVMSGLMNDQEQSKNRITELANEAIEELREEEYEEALGGGEEIPQQEPEEDVDDVLGGDGEEPVNPNDYDEHGELDYNGMGRAELQTHMDAALDNKDYELAKEIGAVQQRRGHI